MQDDMPLESESDALEQLLNQAIVEGFVEVPVLPEVANKAFMLANDKNSDASHLAQLIQSDPSLAGHVMRIANSAAYSPMANLASLQQAITRLGMRTISQIALAAVLNAKLFHTPGYEKYVQMQWHHAMATSLWAREIARFDDVDEEMALLTGLIHSIGRPAVLQTVIDLAAQRSLPLDDVTVHQLEEKYWLTVSQMVVIRWRLPALVIDTIQCLPSPTLDTPAGKMATLITAASWLAQAMLDKRLSDELALAETSIAALHLSTEDIQKLVASSEKIDQQFQQLIA